MNKKPNSLLLLLFVCSAQAAGSPAVLDVEQPFALQALNASTKDQRVGRVPSGQAPAQQASTYILSPGQVRVMELPGVQRIAIGNGSFVTATVVENKQVVLVGEKPGVTTLYIWLKNGRQKSFQVHVSTEDAVAMTAQELQSLLVFDPSIQVALVGSKIILDGAYSDQKTAAKVKKLIAAYPEIVNLIPDVPNDIKVEPQKMVFLEVKVIEARKRAIDNLGIKWTTSVNGPTFNNNSLFYANYGNRQVDGNTATPARPFLSYLGLATQVGSMLNFLESNGDSWTLAEPKISTVSGGRSKFQVGGQVPIPVATGPGQIAVVYKDYGVLLEVEPIVDAEGNIYTKMMTEVSRPDNSAGGEWVSFVTTKTESEVSIKQGDSLVISGLLLSSGAGAKEGVKGLASVPILGRAFSNREFNNEATEMIMVVTPRLHDYASESAIRELSEASERLQSVKERIDTRIGE